MGYSTDFSGSIDLPGLKDKDIKRLENILRCHFPSSSDEIKIEKDERGCRLDIFGYWKNYNEEFQKLVMVIVRVFPGCASGWIDACGEEPGDNWALEISEGKVMFITYEQVVKERTVYFDARRKTP